MNKIDLYKSSINKFIKEYSKTFNLNKYEKELLKSDHIFSIISLTIISSLNRKTKHYIHGYYIALIIELLSLKMLTPDIIIIVFKIFSENIMFISPHISSDKLIDIMYFYSKILFSNIDNIMSNDNDTKISLLSSLSIIFGWIFGGGIMNTEIIEDLKNAGKNLAKMIDIANTFKLDKYDIMFDKFTHNKQKFIEICVTYDIFTETIKNTINMLENIIDSLTVNSINAD